MDQVQRDRPKLTKGVRTLLDRRLCENYAATMNEPVPARHLELFHQFEASNTGDPIQQQVS
jgi:hypothetical protein